MPKITNFGDFWASKPTFLKAITVRFGVRVQTWDSLPHDKFYKIRSKML